MTSSRFRATQEKKTTGLQHLAKQGYEPSLHFAVEIDEKIAADQKVEPGEGLKAALRREIREELGAEIENIRRLTTVRHAYTRFEATLHAFRCRLSGDGFKAGPRQRWVTPAGIRKYPLPSGSVKIVDFLESGRRA